MPNQPQHSTNPSTPQIIRPDPQDIVHSELNLERWPGLWATRDTDQPRTLTRSISYPDGSKFDVELTVSAPQATGTLTTETQKYYSALLKMRQDAWGANPEQAPTDRRMRFTLRGVAKLLASPRPTTQSSRWGTQTLASVKRHIRKLAHNHIDFKGAYWDASKKRRRTLEGGFTIVSDYLFAEERRFRQGTAIQLPLELGYIRLSPWIEDNLDRHYTAPFYFTERIAIKPPFAQQLYNHLNLAMAGRSNYQRRLVPLFEIDFPEMGRKYPAPSQRKRVLNRNLKHILDRKITTGTLDQLTIQRTTDRTDYKLVVHKGRFPKSALPSGTEILSGSRPAIDADTQLIRDCLVEDILAVTRDSHSRQFYEIIVSRVPEPSIRLFIGEINAEQRDPDGKIRNAGALFTTKVKAWCHDNDEPEFWKKRRQHPA